MTKVILFDGECHFCNYNVRFIIKRDKKQQFKFCSLQSDVGQELLHTYDLPPGISSLVLIDNKKAYTRSTAALRISRQLSFPYPLFYSLIIVPKPIRDTVYNIIANNRHKIIKEKTNCTIPTDDIKKRFL